MAQELITYQAGRVSASSALIYDESVKHPRPLMLISPNWQGMSKESIERARKMACKDYIALLVDMYGDGITVTPPECIPLADALRADTIERRARIRAAYNALISESQNRGIGEVSKMVAVGFCFGGGNVLELARDGADLNLVVSIHGDLVTAMPAQRGQVKAEVCIIHGAADPVVPKAHRDIVEAELEEAGVKWQMLTFGHLLHSFSEEEADVPKIARYDAGAANQTYNLVNELARASFAVA